MQPSESSPTRSQHRPRIDASRWPPTRIWEWHADRPWLCGLNYLPSTAVNWTAMWQRASFAPRVIARELDWAAEIGINSVPVGLPYIVWQDDADGQLERLDHVLTMLAQRSMTAMPYLLDDCEFSGEPPQLGRRPDPVPGLHNSRATGSPGRALVMDQQAWPDIERYVQHLVRAFASDDRIVVWDPCNEPGNRVIFPRNGTKPYDEALEIQAALRLSRVFACARGVQPSQPLTAGGWRVPPPYESNDVEPDDHPSDTDVCELSDVISFHAYCSLPRMRRVIERVRRYGRPLICTGWMGRHADRHIRQQLPVLRCEDISSYVGGSSVATRRSTCRGQTSSRPSPAPLTSGSAASLTTALPDDEVRLMRREAQQVRRGAANGASPTAHAVPGATHSKC
jgi:hypothetical protein